MALRIAFDLDGVLADMESELARQAKLLFGDRAATRAPLPAAAVQQQASDDSSADASAPNDIAPAVALDLTPRQLSRLWKHVETIEGFWETLREIEPGAIARLAAIAAARRWEVIFLTKRPASAGATAQLQSQRWLEVNGFRLPSVYVVQGSRGRIASALGLDFVVDDRPENCLDVIAESHARPILIWRDDVRLLPAAAQRLGVGVVRSVAECLDILSRADEPAKPGVVGRVMRLLGFKEPASV